MFSALRSIARLPLRTASTPVSPFFNSTIRCASSASAAPRKAKTPGFMICPNCRREGHTRRQCTEPVAPCVACGEVGHIRRKCPNPDQARLDALNTAPKKCFRCGEAGHVLKECPQPNKCFACGQEGHISRDCPTRPKLESKVAA